MNRMLGHWGVITKAFLMLLAVCMLLGSPAWAALSRVGPIDPAIGYPAWYQDTTGLTVDSCVNLNQAELDGGWCLLLPVDVPGGTAPEIFPNRFAEEHFYWSGGADASVGATKVLLVLGLEEAFGIGPVQAGQQVVFARIRIVINPVPANGDYTVYTPFGKFDFPGQAAGDRLFFTEDIGLAPGDFTQALQGRIGPFLLASATPGGAEMPPVTAANPTPDVDPAHFGGVFAPTPYPGTGKSYIADPARIGPVTGSPLPDYVVGDGSTRNANIFRVEGPGFLTETTDFALSGRLFEGAIAGSVNVKRASYSRTATAQKVDVYATAAPVAQARIPAGPAPASVPTQLSYFDAACTPTLDVNGIPGPPYSAPVGATANQMFATGSNYYGQSQPATLPLEVCVQANAVDAGGQTVSTFTPAGLGDQIFITEALYDSASQSLSVKATSSDLVVQQTLTVEGLGTIDPLTGQLVVNPLLAPPESVVVLSSGRGLNQLQVGTGPVTGGVALLPVAVNDTATTTEDTATTINVLANDTNATGGTVSLASLPLLGTAVVNADGSIGYTPRLNASGTDTFNYTVTVGTQVSNSASITVTISPVNDAPVANPDSFTAVANIASTLNVTSNDTDPDGAADIVAVANLSAVTPATGTATAVGKTVSFTATAAGIYSFTYQAQDAAGVQSNPTTVTVTVASAETISITRAEYVVSKGRIKTQGTISPAAGQSITLVFLNSAGTVLGTAGTTIADAVGNWVVDTAVALPTGASRVRATSSNGSVATATLTLK
ncbi:MAG TPA: cadherin-like domain-containing protein [Candidatus Methylomirabilis sp.]|nr:cadherin-like domain-containing protein [Candidatus Methylomirabilis sp.]